MKAKFPPQRVKEMSGGRKYRKYPRGPFNNSQPGSLASPMLRVLLALENLYGFGQHGNRLQVKF